MRCTHCTLHARIAHVHKTLATSWRLVRATRPARGCRTRCLALSLSWLGRPLPFCFLAPWFESAILTRGSQHKESRTAQACSALCGPSMASRISSGAFTARCSRRFSVCKGRRVLSVPVGRAACAIPSVSFIIPFSCTS